MYRLEYLPRAQKDLLEITRYLAVQLCNPSAAEHFLSEVEETTAAMQEHPYLFPQYLPIRPLAHEYRTALIGNYLLFYWVDEPKQRITVSMVVYAKRSYDRFLK